MAKSKSSKPAAADPALGLPPAKRTRSIALLAAVLADQHVLYQKTRNYHWNLVGQRFFTLHELFEKQYRALAEAIDETAERIRMLEGIPPSSMAEFLKLASLKEAPSALIHGEQALESLADDHAACVRSLREAISAADEKCDDAGTADFLTELIQAHEKNAWMLRSPLM